MLPKTEPATMGLVIVDKDQEDERSAFAVCTPTEREMYTRIPLAKQRDWLFGRLAAKRALRDYFDRTQFVRIPLERIEIASGQGVPPSGKLLDSQSGFDASGVLLTLSHCDEFAAANAVPRGEWSGIGIDIERVHHFRTETLGGFMTEHEKETNQALSPIVQKIDATLRWSLKEAYLKAIGTGLKTHPRTVETMVNLENGNVTITVAGERVSATVHWAVYKNVYMLVNMVL